MPHYLILGSYTADAWANMNRTPADREKAYRKLVENAGGKLETFYYAFGDKDVVAILEAPDATTAAALSMAVAAPGHVKSISTTPLMTSKEGMDAMKKAGGWKYQPPKA